MTKYQEYQESLNEGIISNVKDTVKMNTTLKKAKKQLRTDIDKIVKRQDFEYENQRSDAVYEAYQKASYMFDVFDEVSWAKLEDYKDALYKDGIKYYEKKIK